MITHAQVTAEESGKLTFVTRVNSMGWCVVHMAGAPKGWRVKHVHMSELRADNGIIEILNATQEVALYPSSLGYDAVMEWAVAQAKHRKLEP